jgi:hypothetical protein
MQGLYRVVICIVCLCVSSYSSLAQTSDNVAIDFNNKISGMIGQLYEDGNTWGQMFSHIDSTTKKYAELAPLRIKMEKYLDDKLVELKAMQDVAGSSDFRTAVIHFMELEKGMLNSAFKGIEKLNPHSTDAQIQNAIINLSNESKKEDSALKQIRNIQNAYAKRNGFIINN